MKFPIRWHEDCLKNQRRSNAKKQDELLRLKAEVLKDENETFFYAQQIDAAVAKGKDAFDRDKFMKPRITKEAHL
jgi:hypothetical protein